VKKYNSLNIPVQPRLIFYGQENLVAEIFVLDRSFIFDDPLSAVETAYFLFNSTLDLEYPLAAENVWKVIGALIFNSSEKSSLSSATIGVLNEIKK
jgi:hypothetical protein